MIDKEFDLPEGIHDKYLSVIYPDGKSFFIDFDKKTKEVRHVKTCFDAKNGLFKLSVAEDKSFTL